MGDFWKISQGGGGGGGGGGTRTLESEGCQGVGYGVDFAHFGVKIGKSHSVCVCGGGGGGGGGRRELFAVE